MSLLDNLLVGIHGSKLEDGSFRLHLLVVVNLRLFHITRPFELLKHLELGSLLHVLNRQVEQVLHFICLLLLDRVVLPPDSKHLILFELIEVCVVLSQLIEQLCISL